MGQIAMFAKQCEQKGAMISEEKDPAAEREGTDKTEISAHVGETQTGLIYKDDKQLVEMDHDIQPEQKDPAAQLAIELGKEYTTLESPNSNQRQYRDPVTRQRTGEVQRPSILMIHYTACEKPRVLELFQNSNAQVSSHYLVDRTGNITCFVSEDKRAWHAGYGYWRGETDVNTASIGIENINIGYKRKDEHGSGTKVKGLTEEWYEYDKELIETLGPLCKDIIERYNIKPENVIGHSDMATNRGTEHLGRKVDPGPLFPWQEFHFKYGVGAWYELSRPLSIVALPHDENKVSWIQNHLKLYGYACPQTGILDEGTKRAIKMFQLHFRSNHVTGNIDNETIQILAQLVDRYIYRDSKVERNASEKVEILSREGETKNGLIHKQSDEKDPDMQPEQKDPAAQLAIDLGKVYTILESPNSNQRQYRDPVTRQRAGEVQRPRILMIHYTACEKPAVLELFQNSNAQVSSHYLVDRTGNITRFVSEDKRAWHAGYGYWRGETDVNTVSIGIENINIGFKFKNDHAPGTKVAGLTEEWYAYDKKLIDTLGRLCKDIVERYNIKPENVIGHSDMALNRGTDHLGRKVDPGPLFPWEEFHTKFGVGAWYDLSRPLVTVAPPRNDNTVTWMQEHLTKYGYACPQTGVLDEGTKQTIKMFQLHFRATHVSGEIDDETIQILAQLVDRYIYGDQKAVREAQIKVDSVACEEVN